MRAVFETNERFIMYRKLSVFEAQIKFLDAVAEHQVTFQNLELAATAL